MARVPTAPLVATQSNAHAFRDSPRNLTGGQLHRIRARGGVVGFSFATFDLNAGGTADPGTGRDTILCHLDHLIAEAGEDHVGRGSDFDGCVLPDLVGDVTGVPLLFEALAAHGTDAALIARRARQLAHLPRPVPAWMRGERTPRARREAQRGATGGASP